MHAKTAELDIKVFPRFRLIDRVHFLASAMISFHAPAHTLSSALSVNIFLPYFHSLRTTATFTARGFFPAMPQPELPEPAHAAVDSMLSRKFGKEVANYFSGSPSHNCLANWRAHLPRITLEQSFLLAN